MSYEQYIRQAAINRGIDPEIAVRVAKSEGGVNSYIQSKVRKNGVQEPSYGPFQLLVGGQGTIFPEGMGNQMLRETGLDPRDPNNAQAAIDFALDQAKNKGWGQWYGAKAIGVTGKQGVGSQVASQDAAPPQASGTPAPAMGDPITVGSMVPQTTQPQPTISGGISDFKNGNYLQGVDQVLGSMSGGSGGSQIPQTQPMQLSPSYGNNASNALGNYIAALLGKKDLTQNG